MSTWQAPVKLGAGLKRPGSLATPLAPRNGVELQTPSHLHQNKGNSLSLTISSAQNMTNAPLRPPGEKKFHRPFRTGQVKRTCSISM